MVVFAKIMVRQCANNIAVSNLISVAMRGDALQFGLKFLQSRNLLPDGPQLIGRDLVGIGAGAFGMLAEVDQLADRFNRQAKLARVFYK